MDMNNDERHQYEGLYMYIINSLTDPGPVDIHVKYIIIKHIYKVTNLYQLA